MPHDTAIYPAPAVIFDFLVLQELEPDEVGSYVHLRVPSRRYRTIFDNGELHKVIEVVPSIHAPVRKGETVPVAVPTRVLPLSRPLPKANSLPEGPLVRLCVVHDLLQSVENLRIDPSVQSGVCAESMVLVSSGSLPMNVDTDVG